VAYACYFFRFLWKGAECCHEVVLLYLPTSDTGHKIKRLVDLSDIHFSRFLKSTASMRKMSVDSTASGMLGWCSAQFCRLQQAINPATTRQTSELPRADPRAMNDPCHLHSGATLDSSLLRYYLLAYLRLVNCSK
jgi:hypothetical protein